MNILRKKPNKLVKVVTAGDLEFARLMPKGQQVNPRYRELEAKIKDAQYAQQGADTIGEIRRYEVVEAEARKEMARVPKYK